VDSNKNVFDFSGLPLQGVLDSLNNKIYNRDSNEIHDQNLVSSTNNDELNNKLKKLNQDQDQDQVKAESKKAIGKVGLLGSIVNSRVKSDKNKVKNNKISMRNKMQKMHKVQKSTEKTEFNKIKKNKIIDSRKKPHVPK